MRINSKLPKTFMIFVSKNGKSGYLRFFSRTYNDDKVSFTIKIVNDIKNASKFVNFDNVKKKTQKYDERYDFDDIKIYDTSTGKFYNAKKTKKED